ncbi:MAG: serine O-acetyltransferase [Thermomicrobiales bacterium]|nr:serine O-acetyltransferase [Thermomicrobiales bacterium]
MLMSPEIRAIRERDPAARSTLEVVLASPGLHALTLHRVANGLWRHGFKLSGRLVSHAARGITGIEIHPGATIGRGVMIDHGMGVVIGETAIVGDDCSLYQGVTLGGTGKETGKRHPTLEPGVTVGVGASVLGAITIGEGAKIGAGSVVLRDVPPHATAVGIPARAVSWRDPHSGETRRIETLPDPDRDTMLCLVQRIEELEEKVRALREQHAEERPPLVP